MPDFDPDAYLAANSAPKPEGFDPDAYLAANGAEPSADPRAALATMRDTRGHPTIRGLLDMLPGSHKFIAAADAAKDSLTSDAKFAPSYEKHLAETDALYNQERQDPRFRIGQAAGVLAMPVSSAKGMAALGAAAGAGDARGDFAHTLEGAGLGGAVGAATGLAGPVISKAASSAAPYLDQLAIRMGRKALSGGGAISVAKPLSDEAVREALDSGAIKFGGTVTGAADRLEVKRAEVGDTYGRIVATLERMGIKGPEAETLAQRMVAEGRSISATSMNPAASGAYEQAAAQIAQKPVDATGNLGLSQAESLKRSAQDMAKSAYRKLEPGEVGDAHMGVASMLRQANEDAIQQGAAEAARPTYTAYRGSAHAESTPGAWWSDSPDVANRFATQTARGTPGAAANVAKAELRFANPLEVDAGNSSFHRIPFTTPEEAAALKAGTIDPSEVQSLWRADGLADWAKSRGHDGLILRNVIDGGGRPTTTFVNLGGKVLPVGAAARGAETKAIADSFVPVKQRLGNLIEAGNVADQAASRAGRNKAISLTDTIAGAAGLSHGAGGAFAAMSGNKLLRTRGPSTAASVLSSASKLANLAQTQPAVLGKFAAPLQQAAARGADAVAATHFTLTQDPAYQELMHKVAENDQ